MKLIAMVKLLPSREQYIALKETLEVANRACNFISGRAWETQAFGQFRIQKLTYIQCKSDFGLTAQVAVLCAKKVADAYKLNKKTEHTFKQHGSIAYDNRILRWYADRQVVSIWTVDGRQKIPFACGERARKLLTSRQGESDLVYRDGSFYLFATCNVETSDCVCVERFLGVDLGINEIAVDSEGTSYSGEPVKACRRRWKRIRGLLQSKGTKSAKRHLQKIRRKQSCYARDIDHQISKKIVQTALRSVKALALEDLKGAHERANGFNREMRWLLGNWSFDRLTRFIRYKAEQAGIPVVFVDRMDTSRTCSVCGHIHKANRTSQAHFRCLQCGFESNANYNAARNIEARAALSYGLLSQPSG